MSRKLSEAQRRCLTDAALYGDPYRSCRGRSEHGGRVQVIASLIKRQLLRRLPGGEHTITDEGARTLYE